MSMGSARALVLVPYVNQNRCRRRAVSEPKELTLASLRDEAGRLRRAFPSRPRAARSFHRADGGAS